MEIRNYEDLRKDILKSIQWYEDRIRLWEKVEFVTKKDGMPFKVLSKNFKNAEIGKYYPVEDWASPYLTVMGRNEKGEWVEHQMAIHIHTANGKRLPTVNEEREVRMTEWGTGHEIMTIEEIKSEVEYLIEELKSNKKKCEESLAESEKAFNEVKEIVDGLREKTRGMHSSLMYGLRDYIKRSL